MAVINGTEENFKTETSTGLVLVDFYADWCGPCKMLSPVIESLAREFSGKVKIGKVNTDESPSLAEKYQIMMIPTLLFLKDGKVMEKLVNPQTRDRIVEKIPLLQS